MAIVIDDDQIMPEIDGRVIAIAREVGEVGGRSRNGPRCFRRDAGLGPPPQPVITPARLLRRQAAPIFGRCRSTLEASTLRLYCRN